MVRSRWSITDKRESHTTVKKGFPGCSAARRHAEAGERRRSPSSQPPRLTNSALRSLKPTPQLELRRGTDNPCTSSHARHADMGLLRNHREPCHRIKATTETGLCRQRRKETRSERLGNGDWTLLPSGKYRICGPEFPFPSQINTDSSFGLCQPFATR